MTLHSDDRTLDIETTEDTAGLLSRRTVLRRSALGIMGLGLAPLLAACDEEEEPVDEGVVEEEEGLGEEEEAADEGVVEEEAADEGLEEEVPDEAEEEEEGL